MKLDSIPNGEARQALLSSIGSNPLSHFLYKELVKALGKAHSYDKSAEPKQLLDLVGADGLVALAKELLTKIETLPWDYRLFTKLPLSGDSGVPSFTLSEGTSLRVWTEEASAQFALPKRDGVSEIARALAGIDRPDPTWTNNALYFCGKGAGYLHGFTGCPVTEGYLSELRSFIGLALAVFLLEAYRSGNGTPKRSPILLFRCDGSQNHYEQEEFFSFEEMDLIQSLQLSRTIEEQVQAAKPEWRFLTGDPTSHRAQIVRRRVEKVQKAFGNTPRAEIVRRAGEWYFRARCASNELLRYVQLTTVLEILLGDEEPNERLSTLMANRCAYLIASSHDEREGIAKDFKELYRVRSKILHRGHSRLSDGEESARSKLEWLCTRVIERELAMLAQPEAARDSATPSPKS